MSIQLLPVERAALDVSIAAVDRLHDYCKVMIERGAPLDNLDELSDIHAASACLGVELRELVATIDGDLESSSMLDARRRVLLDAAEIVDRMETNSPTAARLRVLALNKE